MTLRRPTAAALAPAALALAACSGLAAAPALAAPAPITVAYAGSMGVVMDKHLGPAFTKKTGAEFHGIGHGAWGLAQELAAKQVQSDVFVSITPGPMQLLIKDHMVKEAVPVASTQMVIAYSPKGPHAVEFKAAAEGKTPWYKVMSEPGITFGRTDPATDPQGRNIIFSMLLAQHHYHQKDLAKTILGSWQNPKQIFDESSILARLESGQMDATSGYLASVVSQGLPYIKLSDATNLSDPAVIKANADKIHVTIKDHNGKPEALDMEPLVYYAGVLANAKHPKEAAEFVKFLQTPAGQKLLRADGYSAPKGGDLK